MTTIKGPAAVVLLARGAEILAITRRHRVHDLHLPGGKWEPRDGDHAEETEQGMVTGQFLRMTAVRELAEETGVRLRPRNLHLLCSFTAHTGRPVQAYTAASDDRWPDRFDPTDAGWPGWVPAGAVVQPWCTFRAEALQILAARWPMLWGPDVRP